MTNKTKKSILMQIIIILILLLITLNLSVSADSFGPIRANFVNYSIDINGGLVNSKLTYPLISYNNRTYISIRDFALLSNKDVYWDEKNNAISLINKEKEDIIKKPETAIKIAKAVVEEHFSDKFTSTPQYAYSKFEMDHSGSRNYFEIYVTFKFNSDFVLQNAVDNTKNLNDISEFTDIIVTVYCDNGEIKIKNT